MNSFIAGDRVRQKNGDTFSNDEYVLTVARTITNNGVEEVWLKETDTWLYSSELELAETSVEQLEEQLEQERQKATKCDVAIQVIEQRLEALRNEATWPQIDARSMITAAGKIIDLAGDMLSIDLDINFE